MNSSDSLRVTSRWRIDLAYDGSHLHGFAEQPGATTVVGLLRDTLQQTLRLEQRPAIVGAGRTDAGVHAFGQVIHVDLPEPFFPNDRGNQIERLRKSLNSQLAQRVRIHELRRVEPDFHARFSARWRAYRYLVVNDEFPPLALSSWAWSVKGEVDFDLVQRASDALIGTHDFRAFCKRPANAAGEEPLIREVLEASWTKVDDAAGLNPLGLPLWRFDIRAVSFCHQMVRSLTSALVAVGQGQLARDEIGARLHDPKRWGRAGLPGPAPAGGLSLMAVGYDEFARETGNFVN